MKCGLERFSKRRHHFLDSIGFLGPEDVLFRDDRLLFQLVENLFNLMIGLQLLEFHSVKPLENLSIGEQEMTHRDEGVHDAYANVYRSIAMEYG